MWLSSVGLLVTCALGLLWIPLMATAQPAGHVWRLGVLNAGAAPSAPSTAARLQALFWQALRELGWIEGQNLIVEQRSAEGSYERLPELAAELVRLNVDVIVAVTVLCQEGWPLRQQDWPFGLPEPQGGQRQVCREEEIAWDDRSI